MISQYLLLCSCYVYSAIDSSAYRNYTTVMVTNTVVQSLIVKQHSCKESNKDFANRIGMSESNWYKIKNGTRKVDRITLGSMWRIIAAIPDLRQVFEQCSGANQPLHTSQSTPMVEEASSTEVSE